ncbi:hypothetical protein [Sphingobacterium sp. 40-24]|uniref:hypothetical protein n=1 Tax=Sphingobacterium sp. 40-24 TaxID=1895843 RepID=UPI000964A103|nr:hypothetical protein [Sphingobacterium sp. 40-24]OJZ07117.1 MAG: hypothetical protein BGP15_17985 [Sphingobacterium sp. 40-24]
MEKDNNEGISIIKGSGMLHVNWGDEKNGSVLFFQGETILLGMYNVPFALYTTAKFDKNTLPNEHVKNLDLLERLFLTGDYSSRRVKENSPYEIPLWINDLENLSLLYLDHFDLIGLTNLRIQNLKTLVLKNAHVIDIPNLLIELLTFKNLSHIAYDESCIPLIHQFRKHHIGVITFELLDNSR